MCCHLPKPVDLLQADKLGITEMATELNACLDAAEAKQKDAEASLQQARERKEAYDKLLKHVGDVQAHMLSTWEFV